MWMRRHDLGQSAVFCGAKAYGSVLFGGYPTREYTGKTTPFWGSLKNDTLILSSKGGAMSHPIALRTWGFLPSRAHNEY